MRLLHAIILGAFLSACKKEAALKVYTTPKELHLAPGPMAQNASTSPLPGLAEVTQEIAIPHWEAPKDWQAQSLDGIRKGSWEKQTPAGKLVITALAFPGDVGGDLANINRWLGQIHSSAWDLHEMNSRSQQIEVGGYQARYVLLGDESKDSILAVIVPVKGWTWYFKLMGPATQVLLEKAPFETFLQSVQFSS